MLCRTLPSTDQLRAPWHPGRPLSLFLMLFSSVTRVGMAGPEPDELVFSEFCFRELLNSKGSERAFPERAVWFLT